MSSKKVRAMLGLAEGKIILDRQYCVIMYSIINCSVILCYIVYYCVIFFNC